MPEIEMVQNRPSTPMSYDVFSCKDVPFEGSVDTVPHLGGQIAQKSQFWRRE